MLFLDVTVGGVQVATVHNVDVTAEADVVVVIAVVVAVAVETAAVVAAQQ